MLNDPIRGNIYQVKTEPAIGDELRGEHSWVVLQQQALHTHPTDTLVLMAPLVHVKNHHRQNARYFQVILPSPENGLDTDRCVDVFQTRSVAFNNSARFVGRGKGRHLTPAQLDFAASALALIVGA
jgi:mRNA-degrading endonuclease toxin of MazEF toxin-antitoxin module